jgi:hypothetical protein
VGAAVPFVFDKPGSAMTTACNGELAIDKAAKATANRKKLFGVGIFGTLFGDGGDTFQQKEVWLKRDRRILYAAPIGS